MKLLFADFHLTDGIGKNPGVARTEGKQGFVLQLESHRIGFFQLIGGYFEEVGVGNNGLLPFNVPARAFYFDYLLWRLKAQAKVAFNPVFILFRSILQIYPDDVFEFFDLIQ